MWACCAYLKRFPEGFEYVGFLRFGKPICNIGFLRAPKHQDIFQISYFGKHYFPVNFRIASKRSVARFVWSRIGSFNLSKQPEEISRSFSLLKPNSSIFRARSSASPSANVEAPCPAIHASPPPSGTIQGIPKTTAVRR